MTVGIPGTSLTCQLRSRTSDFASFDQTFLDRGFEPRVHPSPTTIVDAGANVGMTTMSLALAYPNARVLALEPDASNFALLQRNTDRFPNVTCVQAALTSHDTVVIVQDPGRGAWGLQVTEADLGADDGDVAGGHRQVMGICLPSLMQRYNFEHIGILKMDIEGSELDVLRSHAEWIQRVDCLVIELHERFTSGCEEAYEIATAAHPYRTVVGEMRISSVVEPFAR